MTDTNVDESLLARDSNEPRAGGATNELPRTAAQKVDDLKHRVADKLQTTAKSLDAAKSRASSLMATAADKIEAFEAPELPDLDLEEIQERASGLIRSYPFRSLAVGLGLGFLVGRALKR